MIDVRLASPQVNVIQDYLAWRSRVLLKYVLCHPVDEVVLKRPFDELVKEIGGEKFVDVCTGEIICE